MSESKNKTRKPYWVLLTLFTFQILFILTLLVPDFVEKNMLTELDYIESAFGKERTDSIVEGVVANSNSLMYESGFIDGVREIVLPVEYLESGRSDDEKFFDSNFWFEVDRAIHNIALNAQYTLLRIYAITPWLGVCLTVIIASIVSGYLSREIKKHGFEYSSPLRHGVARKIMYSSPFIFMVYILAPIAVPVFIVPLLTLAVAIAVNLFVANTIKRV